MLGAQRPISIATMKSVPRTERERESVMAGAGQPKTRTNKKKTPIKSRPETSHGLPANAQKKRCASNPFVGRPTNHLAGR